jgi:hypothetical protein
MKRWLKLGPHSEGKQAIILDFQNSRVHSVCGLIKLEAKLGENFAGSTRNAGDPGVNVRYVT